MTPRACVRYDDGRHFRLRKDTTMALPTEYSENPVIERDYCTEEEYFIWQEHAFERWEWVPDGAAIGETRWGFLRTISGETPDHSAIATNLGGSLMNARDATEVPIYQVFGCSLKIHAADGRNTYPDVSVLCGRPSYHASRRDIITNPILVAEVLSPSTEAYDRSEKWASYQTMPTLQHYLLLSADQMRVELYTREEQGWHFAACEGMEARMPLTALGVTLALADLYALVEFEAGPPETP